MKRFLLITGLVCGLLLSQPNPALAEPAVSASQAAGIANSRYPGKIINVTLTGNDSSQVYQVKILDQNGGMHIVIVDANSGQVLSAH